MDSRPDQPLVAAADHSDAAKFEAGSPTRPQPAQRYSCLEEARSLERVSSHETQDSQAGANAGQFRSRLENRVPPEFGVRSWNVDEVLEGRRSRSCDAIEPVPAEALREEHMLAPATLAGRLVSDPERGLSTAEARARLQRDGPNALSPPRRTPAVVKFLLQTISGFAPILWLAALLCLIAWRPLGNPPDPLNLTLALVLVAVIFLQATFNFYQEYKSDCAMECLMAMLPAQCMTLRDGVMVQLPVSELVVGDIITLNGGEKVPADTRLISVRDMKIDRSTLNGESEPMNCTVAATDKNFMQTKNVAFFGCNVTEGSGTGIVMSTGDRTVFGEIARLAAQQRPGASTLHAEIRRFVLLIVALSLTAGAVAFLGWLFWLHRDYPDFLPLSAQVVNCISLIVAFVPEGMPVCVTVTLALIAKDMSTNNVLVKNLGVVETLGAVSAICSDKTGTLTENRMSVSELSCPPEGGERPQLLRAMALCNRAVEGEGGSILGDASDSALLRHYIAAASEAGAPSLQHLRADWPKVAELPFNSTNKYMLTIHRVPGPDGSRVLLMKGAPERMLERCSSVLRDGSEASLDAAARADIARGIMEAASRGQRILGMCSRVLEASVYGNDYVFDVAEPNFPTSGLVFLGWVALRDPPRDGVYEAIQRCHQAHIRVSMVTGDMRETAQAIAKQVGIITMERIDGPEALLRQDFSAEGRAVVVTGPELEDLTPIGWERLCTYKEAVFARTTPKQKLEIVKAFQARGECVAVTGDGVNDAPALRQADCGVAMGSGSDVSKEAADLVILDDRFTNVVIGIEHGRRCFANLKKVIIYLLPAGSFSEMLPVMTNVFLGMPMALSSFLMIVICCGTDVGPSLSMVYERPETSIMTKPPRKIGRDHLVSWKLLANAFLFIGVIEAAVAYASFFAFYACHGIAPSGILLQFDGSADAELQSQGQAVYFYALVVMQFGNVLTSRTSRTPIWRSNPFAGPTRNLRILATICISACIVALTLYLPFLQASVVQTRALPGYWQPLLLPWAGAIMLVVLNEGRKVAAERWPQGLFAKLAWD
mmetsp:Transcript_33412/g.95723  ORF Transcript_33412/g.95723 Transcript_33412/m.95723 type:complete len:1054 (-) Transcript_33412:271-3432(-)